MAEYEDNDLMALMKTGVSDMKEQFEKLDKNGVIETYGKLKGLESMAHILDATRESLTRLLVVNGVDVTKDIAELRKEWGCDEECCGEECSK